MAGHPRSSLIPSPLASRNPRVRGTTGPGPALQEPSPPGAWPCARGTPEPDPAQLPGLRAGPFCRCSTGPQFRPLCPALQVTSRHRGPEPRLIRNAVSRTSPGTPAPREPRAPHACSVRVGRGGGGLCACAARRPAPRPALRRVSACPPPPAACRPPPPHLGSHLVGAEAGPEASGGPRARTIHGVPGVRGRLPRPVSSPGSAPRSRLREGERREGAGAEGGKRRHRAPARNGPAAAQAPLRGSAPAPGGPGRSLGACAASCRA